MGAHRLVAAFWGKSSITVISYHRVTNTEEPDFPYYRGGSISPDMFKRHMAFVGEHYSVISLKQLIDFVQNAATLPPRPLLITFDDGYLDNYIHAYPVLREFDFPAVVFLMTGAINGSVEPWWEQCSYFFHLTCLDSATLPLIGERTFARKTDRIKVCEELIDALKEVSEEEKLSTLTQVRTVLGVEPSDRESPSFMTWEQIREMEENGIAFQPHTVTHPILTRVSTLRASQEIRDSLHEILQQTQQKSYAFAYPNGGKHDYNEQIIQALRDETIKTAFTTAAGPASALWVRSHPYEIPRVYAARQDSFDTFILKLAGAHPAALMRRAGELVQR